MLKEFWWGVHILQLMVADRGLWQTLDFVWLGLSCALRGRKLPHTPAVNATIWSYYDWSRGGQEWSKTPEWQASVVEHLLKPHVPPSSRVLEIGPGAGRWTQYLLERARWVIGVDVTPRCIALCRERFRDASNLQLVTNDGSDLSFIPANSVDRIWSWDVFCHVRREEMSRYVQQFGTILAPGGRGLIQHGGGPYHRGWRSVISAEEVTAMCAAAGLEVIRQFNAWNDGRDTTPVPPDVITIFSKPILLPRSTAS
ncbi:MAG: class I SAM-dependent methyltransferase [Candidatus Omnitrophica bacterium]|nr:class I SAM-dependent methyltransferase [Candidatus Omnitrophota bacterium]